MSKGAQIALATLSIFIGVALLVTFGGAGEGTFAYYSTVSAYTAVASNSIPIKIRLNIAVLRSNNIV